MQYPIYIMLRAAFLCGALTLVVALGSQSGFGLNNLVEHAAARASPKQLQGHVQGNRQVHFIRVPSVFPM